MPIQVLSEIELQNRWKMQNINQKYYAFYSSILDGISADFRYMMVPLDDHMVHRGDGVFEAIKAVHGRPYLLEAHLQRLQRSANTISLPLYRQSIEAMREIIEATLAHAKELQAKKNEKGDLIIRVYLSRGRGDFSPNPYSTNGVGFFVAVTALEPLAASKYDQGCKVISSAVPVKSAWLAQTKTCNYLPNVMMKKEAVDNKVDFAVSFDERGFLAEGATENIVIVDGAGFLRRPEDDFILRGCTMLRAFELSQELVKMKLLSGIKVGPITRDEILSALEVMMMGTTLDVLPVSEFDGKKIGANAEFLVAKKIKAMMIAEQG